MSTDLEPRSRTPMDLLQLAVDKDGSIDVIERLAKLQMDFMDREDKIAFRGAMTQFKLDLPRIVRSRSIVDKQGDEKYKAVALEDVADPVMKALVKLGVTYRWKTADLPDGRTRVTCILGMQGTAYEEEGSTLAAPPDTAGGKDPLKAVGSTTSYLEKYTLMASVGMHVYGSDPEAEDELRSVVDSWLERLGQAKDTTELNKISLDAIRAVRGDTTAVQAIGQGKNKRLKELKGGSNA